MDTAKLYQQIISVINKSFIEPAEKFGLSVTELQGLDPSIDELIFHLNGLNGILRLFAKDDHSDINMSIDASQCVVIMERIAQSIREEDQEAISELIVELKKHANY
ncbi:hypothetical protein SPONL_32 [uncultured Candidatus Thioglobus sp.]|nr:hypothetical protein SPONL_32 [uncultured Candidatus Thioglobus sp.]